MHELDEELLDLQAKFLVDMNVTEWLAADNVEICPTFDLNVDLEELLTDDLQELEAEDEEGEGSNETDQVIVVPMAYGLGMIHIRELRTFLQQYNTVEMSAMLKKLKNLQKLI